MLVILVHEKVKMGIVLLQMKNIRAKIIEVITAFKPDIQLLWLDERSVKVHLQGLGMSPVEHHKLGARVKSMHTGIPRRSKALQTT